MGEGGIIVPPPDYFREIKKVLDRHGILFICDEVQSGFGRTGKMFAIEHYGVEPDILVTAKGIADGFPARRLHHARRDRRIVQARRPPLHLRRQSGFLRRVARQHRIHAGRTPVRADAGKRRVPDGSPQQAEARHASDRRSPRPRPDGRHRAGERRQAHTCHGRGRSRARPLPCRTECSSASAASTAMSFACSRHWSSRIQQLDQAVDAIAHAIEQVQAKPAASIAR